MRFVQNILIYPRTTSTKSYTRLVEYFSNQIKFLFEITYSLDVASYYFAFGKETQS